MLLIKDIHLFPNILKFFLGVKAMQLVSATSTWVKPWCLEFIKVVQCLPADHSMVAVVGILRGKVYNYTVKAFNVWSLICRWQLHNVFLQTLSSYHLYHFLTNFGACSKKRDRFLVLSWTPFCIYCICITFQFLNVRLSRREMDIHPCYNSYTYT